FGVRPHGVRGAGAGAGFLRGSAGGEVAYELILAPLRCRAVGRVEVVAVAHGSPVAIDRDEGVVDAFAQLQGASAGAGHVVDLLRGGRRGREPARPRPWPTSSAVSTRAAARASRGPPRSAGARSGRRRRAHARTRAGRRRAPGPRSPHHLPPAPLAS